MTLKVTNPADYYDWWLFSGIYPGDPTRAKNYTELCTRLSTSGVTIVLLWDLLLDNSDGDDTVYCTSLTIDGAPKLLAEAARCVCATQLAEYFDHCPNSENIRPEPHNELRHLLQLFAAKHSAELQGDIAKHGDPRSQTGFNKRLARKRREQLAAENRQQYYVYDQLPTLRKWLQKLETGLVGRHTLSEVPYEIIGMITWFKYELPRVASQPQPPEVEPFFEECRQMIARFPTFFPKKRVPTPSPPKPPQPPIESISDDPKLVDRLAQIGEYAVKELDQFTHLCWQRPTGVECELAPISLTVLYEGKFEESILQTWDIVKNRITDWVSEMQPVLIRKYHEHRSPTDDDLALISDDDILATVQEGRIVICLPASPRVPQISVKFDVEWDSEHGCEFEIDTAGRVAESG